MSNLTIFDPQPFQITVKSSKRRKTVGLRISGSGDLVVFTPHRITERTVIKIIKQHETWIFKQIQNNPTQQLALTEGSTIYYMGEKHQLHFEVNKKQSVQLNTDTLTIKNTTKALSLENKVKEQLEKWYINTARDIIEDRVYYYAKLIQEPVEKIRLKNTQTRWGSCSSKRNININWRLIMAPFNVMDYVILHEVCHLKHLNHSSSFWKLVAEIMPDYTKYTIWLKKNSNTLFWP